MYQVKRKNKITETIQLCHADGSVAEQIDVVINVDQLGAKVNKAYELLGIAQNTLSKNSRSPELMNEFGRAVIALFQAIFGDENTEKITSFYEGSESEMLLDLFPFINDVIMPQIREASAARREQLKAAANIAGRRKK